MSVAQRVALQINAKLGSELWGCITPFQQMMVVGIDVYHEKGQSLSVADVVATLNHTFSRYNIEFEFDNYLIAANDDQVRSVRMKTTRTRPLPSIHITSTSGHVTILVSL